ncbi:MAG: (2Fe-2S)-binding protein [Deltaproteobacteria bacterium]|nr:(2Fe-2S)-binding protein [Deltaproteobacteria bacterium]
MPTLKIDGREVTVEPGTTILRAAEELGIEIPTFCYHPGLSIAANCRMCLVDSNKSPKPVPACHAQVMDGMEVQTQSDRIKRTRQAVLEFILLNHPVDCPICDQAGECVLQDHYFKYSAQPSRLFHRKQHKPKAKVLGPDVILDAERCILCTRCVRFCDEVARQPQLDVVNRGEHSEITTFPGMQLDNPYAGNTVDICPVGALTSLHFRFKTRVWFLQTETSTCPECARGCSIRVDTFENVVRRLKPHHNPKVNSYWMCDEGRLAFQSYQDARMEGPTVTSGGRRVATSPTTALEAAAAGLAADKKVAVVVTPWFTNEDAYVVGELLRGPLKGARVYVGGRAPGAGDAILRQVDKNPNRRGLEQVLGALGVATQPLDAFKGAGLDTVLVFGDNHAVAPGVMQELAAVPARIVVGLAKNAWWDLATVFLPGRTHFEKEGTYTNFEGVLGRLERAVKAAPTCKSEGWYAMKLGQLLGAPMDFATPHDIRRAMLEVVKGLDFAGVAA